MYWYTSGQTVSPSPYRRIMLDLSPLIAAFILTTESRTWLYVGVKESFVREHLDVSLTRYAQLLNALIDTELALQLDPVTTRRLRHIRTTRQRSRSLRSA